jgi:hypothetical protein
MTWKLVLTTKEAIKQRFQETGVKVQPGECWEEPAYLNPDSIDYYQEHFFSLEYMRDWMGKRPPISVMLPSGQVWCIDQQASGMKSGWTVTGTIPVLTAAPSILVEGYHGFLQNGVLTDDLDGRSYPEPIKP